jgi:hypothetical protein
MALKRASAVLKAELLRVSMETHCRELMHVLGAAENTSSIF